MVAVEGGVVAGFAQLLSDGEIQAHLSLIAVDPAFRRRGVARDLILLALREAGGIRVDLVTDSAEAFYAALPHFKMSGFRIYPEHGGAVPDDGRRAHMKSAKAARPPEEDV
jgi:ribosomal protein S18 acetylase RimI-like enzyme